MLSARKRNDKCLGRYSDPWLVGDGAFVKSGGRIPIFGRVARRRVTRLLRAREIEVGTIAILSFSGTQSSKIEDFFLSSGPFFCSDQLRSERSENIGRKRLISLKPVGL